MSAFGQKRTFTNPAPGKVVKRRLLAKRMFPMAKAERLKT